MSTSQRDDEAFEAAPPIVHPVHATAHDSAEAADSANVSRSLRSRARGRVPTRPRRRTFPVGLVVISTGVSLALLLALAVIILSLGIVPPHAVAPWPAEQPAFPAVAQPPPPAIAEQFLGQGEAPQLPLEPAPPQFDPPPPPAPPQREPFVPKGRLTTLDLKAKVNWQRDEAIDLSGNDLGNLPMGVTTFVGVNFDVQGGALLLGGRPDPPSGRPLLMTDIAPVRLQFERLYAFHGAHYSLFGQTAAIGGYRLHYDDSTTADLPIVYGEDVTDWFFGEESRVERSRRAWMGRNVASGITFYVTRYDNPHPAKKVVRIDFYATNAGAAPLCLGLTVEQGKEGE